MSVDARQPVELPVVAAVAYSAEYEQVAERVQPEWFSDPIRRQLYQAALKLRREGEVVTPEKLSMIVKAGDKLARALPALVPADPRQATEILRESWSKAVAAEKLRAIAGLLDIGVSGVEAIEMGTEAMLRAGAQLQDRRFEIVTSRDLAAEVSRRRERPDEVAHGLPLPFPRVMPPLLGGRTYVFAGRTGSGKTSFGIQCTKAACEKGAYVGIASVEMNARDLGDRMITTWGVPYEQVRTGKVSDYHDSQFRRAIKEVGEMNFEIIDEPTLRASRLATIQRSRRYDLLILDHLHRIRMSVRSQDRRAEFEDEIRDLVTMSRELDVPLVMLAQLRRIEGKNPRPSLEDLRETAVIEQEAAYVGGLWMEYDSSNHKTGLAELLILKNRFGSEGTIPLRFSATTVEFKPDTRPV